MKEHIDEMTKVLVDYTKKNHIMASHVILEDYAEQLYNTGYRKQSEGEWIINGTDGNLIGNWRCSACNCVSLKDSDYCPNCGAKMKGDKNEQREAD